MAIVSTSISFGAAGSHTHEAAGGGVVLQVVTATSSAVQTGTTTTPNDDTIPQLTEGDEYETVTITPTAADSRIRVDCSFLFDNSVETVIVAAVFDTSVTDAIYATQIRRVVATIAQVSHFHFFHAPGDTNEHIYRLRIGSHSSATTTYNGSASGARFGAAGISTMTATEIAAA